MPGFNHYDWCTCGWCVKHSFDQTIAGSVRDKWIEAAGLYSSRSSCYVQPNATCPVCGQLVFYYQNSNGSRVFFDELGWPWPKHGCTDNSKKADIRRTSPDIRPLEVIRFAKQKCSEAQIDIDANFFRRFGTRPPELVIVESHIIRGDKRHVRVRYLDPSKKSTRSFFSVAASIRIAVGSVASLKDNSISWVDEAFRPLETEVKFLVPSEY